MTHDQPTEELRRTGDLRAAGFTPGPPPVVEGYRALQCIGEGGFGEVWLAEQLEPVQRRVALKVIKAGMDSRQVVARFESERQALALMEHPYIAKVFDAGTTAAGRPFFAMEYVRGLPITEYCDRHRLDTSARLALFTRVCEGVQHAHRKAVIHRDLKPTNVLIAEDDGQAVPKIIDFGVAKATARRLTDRTLYTELGHFVGTPEYMSPEQAAATTEDVDTRADVYSLGVMLYELLTGSLPFDSRELRAAGAEEIRRRLREVDPPRPSTRVSTLGDTSGSVAARRRTDPPSLSRGLRGDLDWIVMRALEKERERRYGSAAELAEDIRRHLANEPVLAGPPGAVYRARKFVRRHRLAVAAAAVIGASLVAGLALAGFGLVRAHRAEAEARDEAATARQVAGFLVDLFEGPDPGTAHGNTITAREVLDRGVERIRDGLEDQPRTRAALMETMGRVYRVMGLYSEALPLLEDAVELRESGQGDDLELASALNELATVKAWLGDTDEAIPLARRSLELRERELGPDDPLVAQSLNVLGNALQNNGDLDGAGAVHRRAIAIREAALGPQAPELAQSLHNLAIVRYMQNDLREAEALYRRSAEIDEANEGPDSYELATSLHTLAIVYQDEGRYDEAIPIERRALAIREKVLGPKHPHVAFSLTTMGNLLRQTGHPADAEPMLRRALAIGEEVWGTRYPEVRWMRRSVAGSLLEQGRVGEARTILTGMIAHGEAADDEASLPPTLELLARAEASSGKNDEAAALYRRSIGIDEGLYGPDDTSLVPALGGLAGVLRDTGGGEEARALYERALGILDAVGDRDSADRAGLERALAAL